MIRCMCLKDHAIGNVGGGLQRGPSGNQARLLGGRLV